MGDYNLVTKVFEVAGKIDNFKVKKKLLVTQKRYLSQPRLTPLMRQARANFTRKGLPYGYTAGQEPPNKKKTDPEGEKHFY